MIDHVTLGNTTGQSVSPQFAGLLLYTLDLFFNQAYLKLAWKYFNFIVPLPQQEIVLSQLHATIVYYCRKVLYEKSKFYNNKSEMFLGLKNLVNQILFNIVTNVRII